MTTVGGQGDFFSVSTKHFDGATYTPAHDKARLIGQLRRIYDLMADGVWRTLREIAEITHAPESSVSAQLRNLRKEKFGSHVIERRSRGNRSAGLFEYRLGG